jgi:hypothetical protein
MPGLRCACHQPDMDGPVKLGSFYFVLASTILFRRGLRSEKRRIWATVDQTDIRELVIA